MRASLIFILLANSNFVSWANAQSQLDPNDLGKSGKSTSGSINKIKEIQKETINKIKKESEFVIPGIIQLIEISVPNRKYSAILTKLSKKTYEAKWSHGAVSIYTIEKFDSTSLVMKRKDTKAGSVAVSGSYIGIVKNDKGASGSCKLSIPVRCNWTATW